MDFVRSIWDRQSIGLAIATMIYQPYTNRRVSIVLYWIIIVFKLGVITDHNILMLGSESIKSYDKQFKGTFIDRNNLIVSYLQKVDLATFLQFSDVYMVYVIVILTAMWLLLSSVTILQFNKLKWLTTDQPNHKPEQPFYFSFVIKMIYNYELIFIYVVNICLNSVTCINYPVEYSVNKSVNSLTLLTKDRQESDQTITQYYSACGLNKGIPCLMMSHFLIGTICAVMMLCNFWIKFIAIQVLNYSPEPKVIFNMYGVMDSIHTAVFVAILGIKTYLLNRSSKDSSAPDYFYISCLILLLSSLTLHSLQPPFYDTTVNRLRSTETLLLSIAVAVVLMVRHSPYAIVHNVNSLAVLVCLVFAVGYKLCLNFDVWRSWRSTGKPTTLYTGEDISRIAYTGYQYVYACLDADRRDHDISMLQTLVYFMNLKKMQQRDVYLKNLKVSDLAIVPIFDKLKLGMKKKFGQTKSKFGEILEQKRKQNRDVRQESLPDLEVSHSKKESASNDIPSIDALADFSPENNVERHPFKIKVTEPFKKKEISSKSSISKELNIDSKKANRHVKKSSIIMKKQPITPLTQLLSHPLKQPNKANEAFKETEIIDSEANLFTTLDTPDNVENENIVIDKFSEVSGSNIRLIVLLIKDLVEEKLTKMIKSSSTSLNGIRTLLSLSISISLNLLGNVPLACIKLYQVQQMFKRNDSKINKCNALLRIKEKLTTSNSFRLEIMRSYISLVLRHNTQTSELVLQPIRSHLTETDKSDNKLKLFKVIDFYNRYNACKATIVRATKIKKDLLESIANTKEVYFDQVFQQATLFNKERDKAENDFKYLSTRVTQQFTALKYVEGYFKLHILQDIKRAKGVLDSAIRKIVQLNFNNVLYDSRDNMRSEDKVVLTVSGEIMDFHKILTTSANCKLHLGYDPVSLISEDLSVLIPHPLKEVHSGMMSFKQSIGSVLEYKDTIPIVALDVDELAVLCRLSARINFQLDKGLQFIGCLDFSTVKSSDCFFLVDKKGCITNTNLKAYRYFEPNMSLDSYSQTLPNLLKDMNRVADFVLHNEKLTPEQIMNDPRVYTNCKVYHEMCTGSEVEILDRSKKIRNIQYIVNDLYYGRLKSFMRCVFFTPGKSRMGQGTLSNLIVHAMMEKMKIRSSALLINTEDDDLPIEDDKQSNSLHSLNQEDCYRMASKLAADHRRQDKVTELLVVIEQKLALLEAVRELPILNQIFEGGIEIESEELDSYETPKEEIVPLRSYISKSSANEVLPKDRDEIAKDFVLRLAITVREKQLKLKRDCFLEIYKFKGLFTRKMAAARVNKIAQLMIDLKKDNEMASVAAYGNHDSKKSREKLSRILNHKLSYRSFNYKTFSMAIIILVSVILQFVLGYLKNSFDKLIAEEFRYKFVAVDVNSWSVWASCNLVLLADTSRSVYEGVLNNSAYSYWTGHTILESNTKLKSTMVGGPQVYMLSYRFVMQNFTMPFMMTADRYTEDRRISMWSPGIINWNVPPSMVNWTEKKMKVSEALSFVQPIIEKYILRNDSAYNYTRIGVYKDKDLMVEFLRRNLVNDLLEVIMADFDAISEYFVNIAWLYTLISRYGELSEFLILAAAALMILCIVYRTRYQMSKFYALMFDIKVGICHARR